MTAHSFRLTLEALEDRCTPATFSAALEHDLLAAGSFPVRGNPQPMAVLYFARQANLGASNGTPPGIGSLADGSPQANLGASNGTPPGIGSLADGSPQANPGASNGTPPGIGSLADGSPQANPGASNGTPPGIGSLADGSPQANPGASNGGASLVSGSPASGASQQANSA